MTGQSASSGDRSSAISIVEAAFKAGRIVEVDRDLRVAQIEGAATKYEIDLVTRELVGAPAAAPMSVSTSVEQRPWPLVGYGPDDNQPDLATAVGGVGKRLGGIMIVVFVAAFIVPIVAVAIGLLSARDSFTVPEFAQPVDETTYLPGVEPGANGVNVFTDSGWFELQAALEEQTGSTQVFQAVVYPRYAVLSVPEGPKGKRHSSWYWNGRDLTQQDSKSTSTSPRITLNSVSPDVLITLVEEVKSRVEDPDGWYAVIDSIPTQGPRLLVYASNDYDETAYVIATLQGEITYESGGT